MPGRASGFLRRPQTAVYGRTSGKEGEEPRHRVHRRCRATESLRRCSARPGNGEAFPPSRTHAVPPGRAGGARAHRGTGEPAGVGSGVRGTPHEDRRGHPHRSARRKHLRAPLTPGVTGREASLRTAGRAAARPRRRSVNACRSWTTSRAAGPTRPGSRRPWCAARRSVLTSVVSAEQQLTADRQDRANVRLGAATVAPVKRRQRLGGGKSSSHVSPFGSFPTAVGDSASVTCNNI